MRPFPPGMIQVGQDYEFPIGRYIPGDVRGPARVITRFRVPAILIAVTLHARSRTPGSLEFYDHFQIHANRRWSTFLFEIFWSYVIFPVHFILY
jgi:hypothetical protein